MSTTNRTNHRPPVFKKSHFSCKRLQEHTTCTNLAFLSTPSKMATQCSGLLFQQHRRHLEQNISQLKWQARQDISHRIHTLYIIETFTHVYMLCMCKTEGNILSVLYTTAHYVYTFFKSQQQNLLPQNCCWQKQDQWKENWCKQACKIKGIN